MILSNLSLSPECMDVENHQAGYKLYVSILQSMAQVAEEGDSWIVVPILTTDPLCHVVISYISQNIPDIVMGTCKDGYLYLDWS